MRFIHAVALTLVIILSSSVLGDPPKANAPPVKSVGQATLSIEMMRGRNSDQLIAKRIQREITLVDGSDPFPHIIKIHPGHEICELRIQLASITYKGRPQQLLPVTFPYQITKDADGKCYLCKGGCAIAEIDGTGDVYAAAVDLAVVDLRHRLADIAREVDKQQHDGK